MNSTNRGSNFESMVYTYLQEELAKENLFVPQKTSKIFQKKGYFSRDRQNNITTDISIETSIPHAGDYSLLTIVECKDYSHKVPVDDIEEFHSKIQQIAGDNIKAIFVTTSALQKGALSYAQSKKIAVIRFLPTNQVQWLIYHMTPDMMGKSIPLNPTEFNSAFTNQGHVGRNRNFYGYDGLNIYGSFFPLLKEILNRE
jgi:predicted helicase